MWLRLPRRRSSSSSPGCAPPGRRARFARLARRSRRQSACGARPDPFVAVTTRLRQWFEAEPWRTSRELFERLQAEYPGVYPDGQLRTCQRRLKGWRREVALRLVFGTAPVDVINLDSKKECPAV